MSSSTSGAGLTRWFLIGTLTVAVGLGVLGVVQHRKRVALERALQSQVPTLARDLQVNARRYSRLWEEADGAGLTGQTDPQSYLRQLAGDDDVLIGSVEITKQGSLSPVKGVVDEKYLIRPQSKDRGFLRVNLANFMHLIEQRSRRMRVTHVRLNREGKPQVHEYGNDRWTWDIEVTSRQKEPTQ